MMISVVIPLYDKAIQVRTTLESVRRQRFTDYEVVIVDDASTDGSVEVVKEYLREHADFAARVRLYCQSHAGVSAARNRAIRESRYEWIAFLDADDTWTSDYLQTQYELSEKYSFCEVLACGYGFRRSPGNFIPAKFFKLPFKGVDGVLDNYFEVAACSNPPLSSITTMARKRAIQAVGGFPEGVSSGEDLLTWAKLASICGIAFNKKCMGVYDQDPSRRNHDQRARMPARNDMVGESLIALFHQHRDVLGLKAYVGLWYKMRTRIYLSNAMKKEAWREWKKLVRFCPGNYKTWVYFILLCSPVKVLS